MGGTYMDQVRVVCTLAEGDPNVAQIFHVHGTGVELCEQGATSDLRRRFHEATIAGAGRWSNAYSEVGTKHIFEYAVRLRPEGDGYLLNGRKFYCTGSLGSDFFYVTAVVEGTDRLVLVLLPTDAGGVTIDDDWSGMGQVTTGSGTTHFEDVPVIAEQLVETDGLAPPESLFGPLGQLSFSAIHLGIAKAAWRDLVEYVTSRTRPWVHSGVDNAVDDPIVQVRAGELRNTLDAAEAMQDRALDFMAASWANPSAESRALASIATAQAKAATTAAGLELGEGLFHLSGSAATLEKYRYDRHWRNARTLTLHDPVDYKYKMVGDYHLTGNLPPVTAYT